ncbi:MAG: type II toxin-antitoxin system PemK/MazF family toxin [Patescibacteria group bacterium]|nr:type II toxin-antitoxin system PemK/MazF family toxin [Patescibacteria group bacterium]
MSGGTSQAFSLSSGVGKAAPSLESLLRSRKRFASWLWVKKDVHYSDHEPPLFKEAEIWWCHAGENVGVETNGKGTSFSRPFLVFKKYDRYSFLGLPLTTSRKIGSWYVTVNFGQNNSTINLAQGRVFDYRRLGDKIGELKVGEFKQIDMAYLDLHMISNKIYLPPEEAGVVGKSQIVGSL